MIELDGHRLDLPDAKRIVFEGASVSLGRAARARVAVSRSSVEALLESDARVYGVNTGFGKFRDTTISKAELDQLQLNLVRSHAVGVGPDLPDPCARAALLFRLNALLSGVSGVRPALVERMAALLNAGVVPCIPAKGSVGSSGDLAPLAHLALILIGEGRAKLGDDALSGAELLARLELDPLVLQPKEGLALINGTQVTLGILFVAWTRARALLEAATGLAALGLEAYGGHRAALDARLHAARPHPGQVSVAADMRALLEGSALLDQNPSVQDPYSLRCAPQVLGASRDAFDWAAGRLEIEMNAATDNPLVFEDGAVSGGNFHGQILGLAAELLGTAAAEVASLSERRTALLLATPDLPEFLIEARGINSGLMLPQYTAAALVAENKVLAHPAVVDSIPTSGGVEDHNSMATTAAYKALQILDNAETVLAIELLCARQALYFRDVEGMAPGTRARYEACAAGVPPLTTDRFLGDDISHCKKLLGEWYGF